MAKIGHLIVCEKIGTDEEKRRFLVNPKASFLINEMKTNLDFVVSMGIYSLPDSKIHIIIEVYDPEGNLISKREGESEPPNIGDQNRKPFSVIVNMSFKDVLIQKEGQYTIKASIEDEEKTLIIPVRLRKEVR